MNPQSIDTVDALKYVLSKCVDIYQQTQNILLNANNKECIYPKTNICHPRD